MDILLRFWDEGGNQVVIKYLTSIHFVRAKAVDIAEMLLKLEEEEGLFVPLSWLCNTSTDGLNINKAIFRNLDENLRELWFKELLEFLHCPLHIMHNAFRKLITSLGETAGQLAFDFHAWFKVCVDKLCQLFFKYVKRALHHRNKPSWNGKQRFTCDRCFYALKKSFFCWEVISKSVNVVYKVWMEIWKFLQIALIFCDIIKILKSVNPGLSSKYKYAYIFWTNQDFPIL